MDNPKKELSLPTAEYLLEVWGFADVKDIDDQTWDCIAENARENPALYVADVELLGFRPSDRGNV